MTTPVTVLSIAGSDSSGGAGIQADLRTMAAHGVHGATAITALTAQNTLGVDGIHAVPAGFVAQQVDSVAADLEIAAVKTGMLASAEIVATVADLAAAGRLPHLVVDPVMVSSTGARLLDAGAEAAYRDRLLPCTEVLTPNRSEAAALCGRPVLGTADAEDAARRLTDLGAHVAVVTGGGSDGGTAGSVDVASAGGEIARFRSPPVRTVNDHGTGCSFSSAVAARLALGDEPLAAVEHAHRFVRGALTGGAGWRLGAGRGPIDHLGWNTPHPPASPQEEP